MKFLRILVNILWFFMVVCLLSGVQTVAYDLTAAQSRDVQAIHLIPQDDQVSFLDSYGFWATDIRTGFKQDAKYRIRSAFGGWNGMRWADYALDTVIAATKPIFVPVAQINALMNYYDRDINYLINGNTLSSGKETYTNFYKTEEDANNALYELYVIYDMGYEDENSKVYCMDGVTEIEDYEYTGSYTSDISYSKWVKKNKKLYNINWKLNKYNNEDYDIYFNRFINTDDTGTRHIKTSAVVVYYQQTVSLVIALIFVIKLPLGVGQGRYVGKGRKRDNEINL